MNSDNQDIPTISFETVSKVVSISGAIFIGLVIFLMYFKLYYVVTAIFAILALFMAIVLVINKKKRFIFYSIALAIMGFILLATSLTESYSAGTHPYSISIVLIGIRSGLSSLLGGVFYIAFSIFKLRKDKSDRWAILSLIFGLSLVAIAINSFLSAFPAL